MIQCPKGTRDYLPSDMQKRRFVMEKIRQIFERYGYSEVCTPAFESLELFEKKGGLGQVSG
jgi:histidyl-tRNA synthetase